MNRFHPQKWERSWEPTEQPAHVPDLWRGRFSSECLPAERVRRLLRHDRPGRLRLPSDRRWIFVLNREKLIIVWSSSSAQFPGCISQHFSRHYQIVQFRETRSISLLFNWLVQLICPISLSNWLVVQFAVIWGLFRPHRTAFDENCIKPKNFVVNRSMKDRLFMNCELIYVIR